MRYAKHYFGLAVICLVVLLKCQIAFGLAIPPVPAERPIVDQTNTLSQQQQSNLAAIIAAERTKSSNQIAILMIPTLDGEALEEYAIKVARQWAVGEKNKNNGVLLLIVKDDRKLRIEVGYGLEGALPDARASQIIRNRITPEFRDGKYYEGINAGLEGIITAIHNEYDSAQVASSPANSPVEDWGSFLFVLLLVPMWLGSILARSKSWWAGGVLGAIAGGGIGILFGFAVLGLGAIFILTILGLLFDWIVSNNYRQRKLSGRSPSWWAGGTRFGGGSSRGFGGFGGGSFGGGGSSGSW